MKIENATLRLVSNQRQRELEQWQQSASAMISTGGSGRPVALEQTYARRENVRLESSQSAYLYSRSQISHAGKPDAVQVVSQETLLQSMVSTPSAATCASAASPGWTAAPATGAAPGRRWQPRPVCRSASPTAMKASSNPP